MKDSILAYIKNNLSNEDLENIGLEEDLLGSGIIDSMGMMRLLTFIEKEADIVIPPEDMIVENFMTLGDIMNYISGHKSADLNEE